MLNLTYILIRNQKVIKLRKSHNLNMAGPQMSNFAIGTILEKGFPQAQVHKEFIARVTKAYKNEARLKIT